MINKFLIFFLFFVLSNNAIFSQNNNSKDYLHSHVEILSSDLFSGRSTCTLGDTLAKNYIQNVYNKIDLEKYPFCPDYFQNFPFLTNIHCNKNTFELRSENDSQSLGFEKDFNIYSFSGNGNITGDGVYISPILFDSIRRSENKWKKILKNKIVFLDIYYSPDFSKKTSKIKIKKDLSFREKPDYLYGFGVKAVVYINPEPKNFSSLKIENQPIYHQKEKRATIPTILITESTFLKIMKFSKLEYLKLDERIYLDSLFEFNPQKLSLHLDISLEFIYKNASNIIGIIKGKDTLHSIIIGAHYDHFHTKKIDACEDTIFNGADDNASGVAILLETARLLKIKGKPKYNIVFIAFGAEEKGICGSFFFLEQYLKMNNKEDIVLMINFDMVGRMKEDKLYAYSDFTSEKIIESLLKKKPKYLNILPQKGSGMSDIYPFYKEKIPYIWFHTGTHEDYHKVSDIADKINYDGMEKILDLSINFMNIFY